MSIEQTLGPSFLSLSPLGIKDGDPHDIDRGKDVFMTGEPPPAGSNNQSSVNLDKLKELAIPSVTQSGLALSHALQERVNRDTYELDRSMGIERSRHTIQEANEETRTVVLMWMDVCNQTAIQKEIPLIYR